MRASISASARTSGAETSRKPLGTRALGRNVFSCLAMTLNHLRQRTGAGAYLAHHFPPHKARGPLAAKALRANQYGSKEPRMDFRPFNLPLCGNLRVWTANKTPGSRFSGFLGSPDPQNRSEEHTSELQSLMRN